jgi:preprotein translocase subunit YajC
MSLFINSAYAQEAATSTGAGAPSWMGFVPFVLMFLVFYFLIIRPQARKQKDTQDFMTSLKKGDQVLTAGGIFGTIEGITDRFVDLRVSESTKFKILKSHLAGTAEEKTVATAPVAKKKAARKKQ